MRRINYFRYGSLVVFLLVFCCAAWAQQDDSGSPTGTPAANPDVTFNEKDVITGSPTRTEYLPPLSGGAAYGAIWFSTSYTPYFDRSDAGAVPLSVDITCNGSNGPVGVPIGTPAKLDFSLVAGTSAGLLADVWIVLIVPFGSGFYSYDGYGPTLGWWPGVSHAYFTGNLVDMSGTCLNSPVPAGNYRAIIGVETPGNGVLNLPGMAVDVVVFHVP